MTNPFDEYALSEKVFSLFPYNIRTQLYHLVSKKNYDYYRSLRDKPQMKPAFETNSLFVHIPKAAGKSICSSLYGKPLGWHASIRHYEIIFSKQELDRMFTFTIVRNPWDRLVSAYNFTRQGGFLDADGRSHSQRSTMAKQISDFASFDDFVKNFDFIDNVRNCDGKACLLFIPQWRFITGWDSKIAVDFIGKLENLAEDFKHITSKIGTEATLKHVNKSRHKKDNDYRSYYSDESAEIVANLYKKDIELLDYRFE